MDVGSKEYSKKLTNIKLLDGRPFEGKLRPSQLSTYEDGSLDPNLICQYCKDKGHELVNCRQLQHMLSQECLAIKGIVAQQTANYQQVTPHYPEPNLGQRGKGLRDTQMQPS